MLGTTSGHLKVAPHEQSHTHSLYSSLHSNVCSEVSFSQGLFRYGWHHLGGPFPLLCQFGCVAIFSHECWPLAPSTFDFYTASPPPLLLIFSSHYALQENNFPSWKLIHFQQTERERREGCIFPSMLDFSTNQAHSLNLRMSKHIFAREAPLPD